MCVMPSSSQILHIVCVLLGVAVTELLLILLILCNTLCIDVGGWVERWNRQELVPAATLRWPTSGSWTGAQIIRVAEWYSAKLL